MSGLGIGGAQAMSDIVWKRGLVGSSGAEARVVMLSRSEFFGQELKLGVYTYIMPNKTHGSNVYSVQLERFKSVF